MKATRAATITNKYIKNPDYYRKLEAFGQWDGDDRCPDGCCGFTGLNMLISYHDKYKNDNIMDDNYWVDNSNKTKMKAGKYSLTKHLFELAPKATTTSMHIHSVMKLYLKERNMSVNHYSYYWGVFNDSTVRSFIEKDVPVELFCSIQD